MTREDIKQICQIYDNLRRERDTATIAYNSDDTFWEHVLATYNFLRTSLPENLDEAANKFAVFYDQGTCNGIAQDCFKAGAEWMASQGVSVNAISSTEEDGITEEGMKLISDYLESLPNKTEVVLQIRKKQ